MEYKFKVEIEVDEQKVLVEDKYYLEDIYSAIDKTFGDNGISKIGSDTKRMIFATDNHDEYSNIWLAILATEDSAVMPYLSTFKWFNNETGEIDNIIEESNAHGRKISTNNA